DSRSPRDGRFIEKLGTYNPNTNPVTIELNFESTVKWIANGAQPTDTVKALIKKANA
ncbi:MAG: 30S ribosomal protein S16, partial [Oscillospiraceae bacterium]